MLRQACQSVAIEPNGFVTNVMSGLEIGARQYGEYAYRGRDNVREGLAEARDSAAYALMEIADIEAEVAAGRLDQQTADDARFHLLHVIVLAAQMDTAFRYGKQARRC